MRRYSKLIATAALALVVMDGCSHRRYFEPNQTLSASFATKSLDAEVIDVVSDGGSLVDDTLLGFGKKSPYHVAKGFRYLTSNSRYHISAHPDGTMRIATSKKSHFDVKLGSDVVSASIYGNRLYFILANNHYGAYDISKKRLVFNKATSHAYSVDKRAAKPLIVGSTVYYPMLDGKIIKTSTSGAYRDTIYLDASGELSNIIGLYKMGGRIVVVTHQEVSIVGGKRERFEIDGCYANAGALYIFKRGGEVLKYNSALKVVAKKRYDFAHIAAVGMANGGLYMLDYQGYIIASTPDLKSYRVYETTDVDSGAFVSNGWLYVDDEAIALSRLGYGKQ